LSAIFIAAFKFLFSRTKHHTRLETCDNILFHPPTATNHITGFGILGASLITLIASSSINFAYPANRFPIEILGCASFLFEDPSGNNPCPLNIQQAYATQIMGAAPNEVEFIW
jgi:hypothetical protein